MTCPFLSISFSSISSLSALINHFLHLPVISICALLHLFLVLMLIFPPSLNFQLSQTILYIFSYLSLCPPTFLFSATVLNKISTSQLTRRLIVRMAFPFLFPCINLLTSIIRQSFFATWKISTVLPSTLISWFPLFSSHQNSKKGQI